MVRSGALMTAEGFNPHMRRLLSRTAAWPRGGGRALDAGCGDGRVARWLATQDWNVTAVDIISSDAWIDRVPQLRFQSCDLRTCEPGSEWDLICLFGVIHCLSSAEEVDRVLGRTADWCGAEGLLLLSWICDDIPHLLPTAFLPPQSLVRAVLHRRLFFDLDYWQADVTHSHGEFPTHTHRLVYSSWRRSLAPAQVG